MRKTLVVSLVLCVVVVFAYAQIGLGADTAAKPAKNATTYKGYVQGVDQTAKSFTLSSCPTCQDVIGPLYVNADTKYSPKGTGWDDVKQGAHVSGNSKTDKDGKRWAVTVNFHKASGDAKKTGGR